MKATAQRPTPRLQLTEAQRRVLQALAEGWRLKAHRDVEGRKQFRLHAPEGEERPVAWRVAEALAEQGLIDSNKKFPAATFWLTEGGRAAANALPRP